MQILVLHQDPAVRGTVARTLQARFETLQCYEITSAAQFEQALELGNFDAVLTGERLGWGSGIAVLPRIKARCADAPVLLITEVNDVPYAVEALRSGFSDYVLLRDLPRLPDALLAGLEQAQVRRQRAAELEQLQAAAEHYRIAAELASDFAYTLHMAGPHQPPRLEWASGAFSRITGYNLVDVLSTGWAHFIDPRDLPMVEEHARHLAAGEPGVVEYRLIKAGGGACWLRNSSRPVWDASGKWIEYIYGAAQDISARKAAEAERENALDTLSRQEAALREALAALEKAHGDLETRVQDRTSALLQRETRLREALETLARRETELHEALHLGEALNEINRAINSTLDFAEIMQHVMVESTRALGCDSAGVMQPEGQNWIAAYVYGLPPSVVGRSYPREQVPHAELAIESGDVIAVADMLNDRPGPPARNVEAYDVRSSMAVPMLRRGEALGVIFFNYHAHPVNFSRAQIDFGRKLASAISLALENAAFVRRHGTASARADGRTGACRRSKR